MGVMLGGGGLFLDELLVRKLSNLENLRRSSSMVFFLVDKDLIRIIEVEKESWDYCELSWWIEIVSVLYPL